MPKDLPACMVHMSPKDATHRIYDQTHCVGRPTARSEKNTTHQVAANAVIAVNNPRIRRMANASSTTYCVQPNAVKFGSNTASIKDFTNGKDGDWDAASRNDLYHPKSGSHGGFSSAEIRNMTPSRIR